MACPSSPQSNIIPLPQQGELSVAQLMSGVAVLPTRLDKLEQQVAALRASVEALIQGGISGKAKDRKWLKLKEAAEILNTSPKTVRRHIERGLLRKSAASRHILIPREDVESFGGKVIL